MEISKLIILGSGPAGLTAAIYAARANLNPVLIHGLLPGGQLTTTTAVENYPGFEDGIQGPELMQKFEQQAKRFGTQILTDQITKVDLNAKPFKLIAQNGKEFLTESLIIATGANPKFLGLPNEKELLGYGVSTCATCDGAFFKDCQIAVVGGGDSACEEALFLSKFGSKVFLIHRREELRASKIMQKRVFDNSKIEVLWNKEVKEIIGDKESGLKKLMLFDNKTKDTKELNCEALFVAIGHTPNSELFKNFLNCDENGYIVTKPNSTNTNVPGVFACGDVQDHVFRQAVTAAGTGCMAAMEAERWLASF